MRLVVEPMELEDIPQVLEVDRESYTLPWPSSAYRREVMHNRNARYIVLRELGSDGDVDTSRSETEGRSRLTLPFFRWPHRAGEDKPARPGRIVGYAGMWIMVDEAHITTIAMRSSWRGQGLGELLLSSLIELAGQAGVQRVTLEVRVSNEAAQNLYRKYGFHQEGMRPRYYSDNNEDAYIMSTDRVSDTAYQNRFENLVETLYNRLVLGRNVEITAPVFRTRRIQPAREVE